MKLRENPMRIRPALATDATAIAAAERETARTPGLLVGRPGEIPVSAYADKIAALAPRGSYVVAEEAGALVGHGLLEPMPMRANAHVCQLTLVVHPGHLGRGIGSALLEHLLDWARQTPSVHKVELHVRSTNERAIRLYRRAGFIEEGRMRDRIRLPDGATVDDLLMGWFPDRAAGS